MVEDTLEVFMDDFLVMGDSFDEFLMNLSNLLQHCEEFILCLIWQSATLW